MLHSAKSLNPLDFDIFYLDGKLVKDPYVVQEAYEFHSGVAYIIKPEAARKVINKVQEFGFSRALDWELIIMRSHGLKLKSFNNIVIVPKEGEKSDIKIDRNDYESLKKSKLYKNGLTLSNFNTNILIEKYSQMINQTKELIELIDNEVK